jgi:hypothetical protein
MSTKLSLNELYRIKQWHVDHRDDHPMENHLWDGMLTLWVLGWMGWLPAMVMDALWALPLCAAGIALPRLYVAWRERAHLAQRLRCDWLDPDR